MTTDTEDMPGGQPRTGRLRPRICGVRMTDAGFAAGVGSALVLGGVVLPWADFGSDDGSWWSLFDLSAPAYSFPFAVEPLVVAVVAPLLAVRASRRVAGIMLTTIGAQTLLMFAGLAFGPLLGNLPVGLGGPIGMLGAASITGAGLLLLDADARAAARATPRGTGGESPAEPDS